MKVHDPLMSYGRHVISMAVLNPWHTRIMSLRPSCCVHENRSGRSALVESPTAMQQCCGIFICHSRVPKNAIQSRVLCNAQNRGGSAFWLTCCRNEVWLPWQCGRVTSSTTRALLSCSGNPHNHSIDTVISQVSLHVDLSESFGMSLHIEHTVNTWWKLLACCGAGHLARAQWIA